MKFNQALLAALVLGTSGVALANGGSFAPVPAAHHTGAFYIGAGVSIDMGRFDTNFNTQYVDDIDDEDPNILDRNTNFDWAGEGVNGDLYVGYLMNFEDRYSLGIELFGLISSLKGDHNHTWNFQDLDAPFAFLAGSDQGEVKMKYTLGVALLPGVKMTDSTTLYARVGYVNSRFETDYTHNVTVFGVDSATVVSSNSNNKGGIQLGLGVQTNVTNNVAVRLEGDWERYGTVDLDNAAVAPTLTGGGVAFYDASVKPTVQSIKASAIYFFNAA